MANLWIELSSSNDRTSDWSPTSLDGAAAVPLLFPGDDVTTATALLLCSPDGDTESWMLMCIEPAAVTLNGDAVHGGIRVLDHKDELRVAGRGRAFLSTERLARVEPFPGAAKRLDCPRCKLELETGQLAVRCPNPTCGRWFHQSTELPCWTYDATCVCGHPTALDGGYRWTPEGL